MKLKSTLALSAIAAVVLSTTGCGDTTCDNNTTTATATTIDPTTLTAKKAWADNVVPNGSVYTGSTAASAVTGVDEANVWKGNVGNNTAVTSTAGGTTEFPFLADTTVDHAYSDTDSTKDITSSTTWSTGEVVTLDGQINVKNNAVLTIQPGVVVVGKTPSTYLAINQGSKIMAEGNITHPIVFTSMNDFNGSSTTTSRGEWGGLVLLGKAYTHGGELTYEAGTQKYGSATHANDAESSGSLKYVAVKHSGFEVETDKELNGLSLGGVGHGTTLENIAILGGADDAIEIWGGMPDITGLYLYNASDDSFDIDLGYRGTATNVLAQQGTCDKDTYDSSTIESGNDHNVITTTDANATQPTIINGTFHAKCGGIYLKNDAGMVLNNVIVELDNTVTSTQEVVKHRTSDGYTTDAIRIGSGGVDLINKNDSTLIYATDNSKSE